MSEKIIYKQIISDTEKSEICARIVSALPEWFDEKGRKDYTEGVPGKLMWAGFAGDRPVGFVSIKENNEYTYEIYVTGVLKEYQRQHIGSELLDIACKHLRGLGVRLLAVKTLDASVEYEPYVRTRNFYLKQGFLPVDVYKNIWNEENPCLVMVKIIGNNEC